jgi:hypothetical protein
VLVDGVLDGERVQPELFGEDLQVGRVGLAEVQPDHRTRLLEVVRDLGGWEVLDLQHPIAIEARATHRASVVV